MSDYWRYGREEAVVNEDVGRPRIAENFIFIVLTLRLSCLL